VPALWLAVAAATLWIVAPLVVAWRARQARQLDEFPADPPGDAPLLSVVIPARDEARNIVACARSLLATTYPMLEVIVVDDASRDGTGDLARRLAAEDERVRVVSTPPLPSGWFGKPWACATGAAAARGALLCFVDADTRHTPDLLGRAVHAMRARSADVLSVAGRQELGTFWERVIQPQVFTMITMRYGGPEIVNRSPRVHDKIANGQFILVAREAYDAIGGHAAVRDKVAEDLMLAQRFFAAGRRVILVLGVNQLSTRMYTSLGELVRGWRKNIFAGSADSLPPHAAVRALLPLLLLLGPLVTLAPVVALAWGLAVQAAPLLVFGAVATVASLVWWAFVYRSMRVSLLYALAFPLGALLLLYIVATAVLRGRRVEWKGREYVSA
jgi:cellulose synthase/poly-beta-1,6-N-acetylglucosamine synthase-like glycosyltransferase